MTIQRPVQISLIGLYTLAMERLAFLNEIENDVVRLIPSSALLSKDDIRGRASDFLYAYPPDPFGGERAVEQLIEHLTYDEENNQRVKANEEGTQRDRGPSSDFMAMHRILAQIADELGRQILKWGEQDHPSIRPFRPDYPLSELTQELCAYYGIPTPVQATQNCDDRHRFGDGSWADIAVEELSEAVAAAIDGDDSCRAELVQLGAVVVAWIQCIDQRAAAKLTSAEEGGSDA